MKKLIAVAAIAMLALVGCGHGKTPTATAPTKQSAKGDQDACYRAIVKVLPYAQAMDKPPKSCDGLSYAAVDKLIRKALNDQ